jgi:hypothetical protein
MRGRHPSASRLYAALHQRSVAAGYRARRREERPAIGWLRHRDEPLVATASDEDALQAKIRDTRARIAFYPSTPTYRRPFELHGYGELAAEMAALSKAQRWEEMPSRVPDGLYDDFVTWSTYDSIAAKLKSRYGDCVTSVEFSIPVESEADAGVMRELIQDLRRAT